MSSAHSKFSASAAHRWMACPGSVPMSAFYERKSSVYADEGTAAHLLLSWALSQNKAAHDWLGETVLVGKREFEVDDEMADAVETAAQTVRIMQSNGALLLDTRVSYSETLGVPEQDGFGTSDVAIVLNGELQVHDYKHGRGVIVEAQHNEQLMLYGLGTLEALDPVLGPFEKVRLVIHQPRVHESCTEWLISAKELREWGNGRARSAAASVINAETGYMQRGPAWFSAYLNPGEDQCRFCPAAAECPELRKAVTTTVYAANPSTPDEFDDLSSVFEQTPAMRELADTDWLASAIGKVDTIEAWCKAVRAEVERRLLAAIKVPGWKLVQGKKGARKWLADFDVANALRDVGLSAENIFVKKVVTPAVAEKLVTKTPLGKNQWRKKLVPLITQTDSKLHVAPESDSRPAVEVNAVGDEFNDLTSLT